MKKTRRSFLQNLALTPLILGSGKLLAFNDQKDFQLKKRRVQYSINAYSFNAVLRSGEMTFFYMMDFCAELGMDAVDLTCYYFSSYPEIQPNKELFAL